MAGMKHREGRGVIGEIGLRFLLGGVLVMVFAVLGDMFQPKHFAGIFGAAPSVALATLGITFAKDGGHYAALEGRSMLLGALAFVAYALVVGKLLTRESVHPSLAAGASWSIWLLVAFGIWKVVFA